LKDSFDSCPNCGKVFDMEEKEDIWLVFNIFEIKMEDEDAVDQFLSELKDLAEKYAVGGEYYFQYTESE